MKRILALALVLRDLHKNPSLALPETGRVKEIVLHPSRFGRPSRPKAQSGQQGWGWVPTFLLEPLSLCGCPQQTLQSAQHDAQHNVAVVQKETAPQLKKLDLGARVTAAITASAGMKGTSIRVDAGADGVKLRGTVNTATQKELAGRIAADTLGPGKTVGNELHIKG